MIMMVTSVSQKVWYLVNTVHQINILRSFLWLCCHVCQTFYLFSHRNTLFFFVFWHFQWMSRLFIWTQEEIEVTRCIPLFWAHAQTSCLTVQLFGGQDDGSPFSRASELESSPLCVYLLTPVLLRQQPGADRSNANLIWLLAKYQCSEK